MTNEFRFDGKVAVVTGAGGGLGRAHALLLAGRGAAVVVNDLGGSVRGEGTSSRPADLVVAEIKAAGGEAVASYDSVEAGEKIVRTALDTYGRVDIIINNAGILRDVSFHKMTDQDWDLVLRVHLYGAYKVTHAAWPYLRDQMYGRVIMTTSASGLYGSFGQANYSAAKLGLLGLTNTLAIEGAKRNIHVNAIAPVAGSRMTATIMPEEIVEALKPDYVSPLVAYLCHEGTQENGSVFEVGAGWFAKLRWQRTQGATVRLSRPVTIEAVAERWAKITDWTEATHPQNVQEAVAPALTNLQSIEKKIGNDYIDPEQVVGYRFPPETHRYTRRDLSLYALGVGAATDPLNPQELPYVYEGHTAGFQPLPTFAVTLAFNILNKLKDVPGLTYDPMLLLHGEQYLELKQPLPPEATVTSEARIAQAYDKGSGALLVIEATSRDEAGQKLAFNRYSLFIRGIGNFGGERGPSGDINLPPERHPDVIEVEKTSKNQALLYRLSGDPNPLHADPAMAASGGFERPILHGLCTFGFVARAVIKHFCEGDASRFKSIQVRFARHVFPGEALVTEMWREGETHIIFRTQVAERDEYVLTNGAVELLPAAVTPTAGSETP